MQTLVQIIAGLQAERRAARRVPDFAPLIDIIARAHPRAPGDTIRELRRLCLGGPVAAHRTLNGASFSINDKKQQ